MLRRRPRAERRPRTADRGHKDRTALSSPDKGNVKDEGVGLSVLRTEGFERNSSSPKERNGCSGRKIMHFGPKEIGSDDPSQPRLTQVLEHEASSPHAFRASSEMASGAPKSPTVPSHFLKVSFGLSKPRDFPGKRKHAAVSVDVDTSGQSEMNDPAFSRSPSKCKARRCDFVKNIFLKSPLDDVLQLKEPAVLSRHDLTLSEDFFNSSNEKKKNNYSTVGLSSSYSAHSPPNNNHISVVDTKENQLQLANSCFSLDKSLPLSQEKSTVLPSPHYLTQTKGTKSPLQAAGLSQVLDVTREQDKRPERHERNKGYSIQPSNSFSNTIHEIFENSPDSCRMEISGKHGLSPENAESVSPSLPVNESFMDSGNSSSQTSGELEVKRNFTHKSKLNRKWQSSSESEDDILESVLDDDDEEVVLTPLQKMLNSSLKPQTRTLEDSSDSVCQDTVTPLLNLHLSKTPVISKVSYVNSLDHLLKEKEESRRLEEIEKLLQEDIEREDNASDGENEDNANGDDLLEEHSSGLTQQLFLVVNGVLSSAYRASLCPIPILKWLFQMMSIHPDHCVSTQILGRLMELTLKNSSINDQQFKPWIPSIADISVVFVNMGVEFRSLFPLQHLQPPFNEQDILEVKRRLSLVIIAKFLRKRHVEIPDDSDGQMFLLHHFLVCMKPSYLLKKMREMRKGQEEHKDYEVHAELEHEVYYLVYVLLHLVSEASCLDVVNSSQRQHLLKLCRALDKHVKGDIREDARMFYRSKGKLHDFWEPDS
ncbi:hypothetical protein TURU_131310 [Turdus rufiventris]|nr:hypothetical protein TURU_131310 [Turdus rufiventris]